ncbi:MAG: Glyoxalase/bleomycin resistance protein/dioxygenase [Planctomycetaceae bacterium]|nr:Glyoxalase/bleomycin resistance protein/dioxygenase [Planctomycetaceae bacterium]
MNVDQPVTNRILRVLAYLRVRNAPTAIQFYCDVFGAREQFRLTEPSGRVGHAQLQLGPSVLMISDEYPEHGILSPLAFGGTGITIYMDVDNVDELTDRAVAAGAKLLMAPKDQFYGQRSAKFLDPFGHEWLLGHQIEDVSTEEMQRRFDEMCRG